MLLFMDGASHYGTAEIGQKWTALDQANATWVQAAEGRSDGCIKKTALNNNQSGDLTYTPLLTQAGIWTPTISGTFGHAVKIDDLTAVQSGLSRPSTNFSNGSIFSVFSGIWEMFAVSVNQNGSLNVWTLSGSGFSLKGTSVQAFNDAEWLYVEYQWAISTNASTANGRVEIRANQTPILVLENIVTFPDVLGTPPLRLWNAVQVLQTASVASPLLVMRQCDVYLCDRVASADPAHPNDTFLGDIRVAYIKPDGVGAQSNWTPTPGPNNWEDVNEVPPDSDTSYVEASVPGTRDTYAFEDVVGDPMAIQVCGYLRKTDDAGAEVTEITRQGGVDHDGVTQGVGSTSYDYRLWPQDINPATGLRWTKAEMDAGEWGPLKVS